MADIKWLETAVSDIAQETVVLPDIDTQRLINEMQEERRWATYELRALGPNVHTLSQCNPSRVLLTGSQLVTQDIQII